MEGTEQSDIYIFDEPEQPEVTPSFVKATQNWDKFRETVLENKNQQFDPKVLKQNVLLANSNNNRSNAPNKQQNQFLEQQTGQQEKDDDTYFVAENLSQYQIHQIIQQQKEVSNEADSQVQTPAPTTLDQPDSNCLTDQPLEKKKYFRKKKQKSLAGTTLNYHMNIPEIIIHDKKALLTSQIPEGIKLKCKLKRRKGILSFISPQYDFYLDSGFKHLISAQKHMLSQDKVFKLSMDVGEYSSKSVVCDLYCNALHSHYLLIEKGQQQKEDVYHTTQGEVIYEKLNKNKMPRQMRVSIPYRVNVGVRPKQLKVFKFNQIAKHHKIQLHSKEQLDNSIYPIVSEKNFELVDSQDDFCYLRLKKESDNIFSIEIQHPLSPLQAFAIVLTRFDAQIK